MFSHSCFCGRMFLCHTVFPSGSKERNLSSQTFLHSLLLSHCGMLLLFFFLTLYSFVLSHGSAKATVLLCLCVGCCVLPGFVFLSFDMGQPLRSSCLCFSDRKKHHASHHPHISPPRLFSLSAESMHTAPIYGRNIALIQNTPARKRRILFVCV